MFVKASVLQNSKNPFSRFLRVEIGPMKLKKCFSEEAENTTITRAKLQRKTKDIMKIFFDHIAGQTQERELIYSPASAIFNKEEYLWAVENGWQIAIAWDDDDFSWFNECKASGVDVWYQSRISRIDLSLMKEKSRYRAKMRKSGADVVWVNDPDKDRYWEIYRGYIKTKNYSEMYGSPEALFKPIYGERKYLQYSVAEEVVAFSAIEFLGDSAIALQFCWDYKEPNRRLGYVNKYYQFRKLREMGCKYMYLGTSYEVSSLKKCEYKGFEWWTGRDWSKNVELYKDLVLGETKMETLEDLHKQQRTFYSRVDI